MMSRKWKVEFVNWDRVMADATHLIYERRNELKKMSFKGLSKYIWTNLPGAVQVLKGLNKVDKIDGIMAAIAANNRIVNGIGNEDYGEDKLEVDDTTIKTGLDGYNSGNSVVSNSSYSLNSSDDDSSSNSSYSDDSFSSGDSDNSGRRCKKRKSKKGKKNKKKRKSKRKRNRKSCVRNNKKSGLKYNNNKNKNRRVKNKINNSVNFNNKRNKRERNSGRSRNKFNRGRSKNDGKSRGDSDWNDRNGFFDDEFGTWGESTIRDSRGENNYDYSYNGEYDYSYSGEYDYSYSGEYDYNNGKRKMGNVKSGNKNVSGMMRLKLS